MNNFGNIYWFLRGSSENPSSRIHGLNIHKYLRAKGCKSYVICEPLVWLEDLPWFDTLLSGFIKKLSSNDIVIVQKMEGNNTIHFLKKIQKSKACIIYLDCDYPVKKEASYADWVVTTSEYLRNIYIKEGFLRSKTIEDPVEYFIPPVFSQRNPRKIVWYGRNAMVKWKDIDRFKAIISSKYSLFKEWEIITISNSKEATYFWRGEKTFEFINSSTVVVIPSYSNTEASFSKSSNRITQAMALGVPVLCSPIPSYMEVVKNGYNGYLCTNDAEWIKYLKLLENQHVRYEIACNAYDYVKDNFSIEVIGEKWVSFFNSLVSFVEVTQMNSLLDIYLVQTKFNVLLLKANRNLIVKIRYIIRILFSPVTFILKNY